MPEPKAPPAVLAKLDECIRSLQPLAYQPWDSKKEFEAATIRLLPAMNAALKETRDCGELLLLITMLLTRLQTLMSNSGPSPE